MSTVAFNTCKDTVNSLRCSNMCDKDSIDMKSNYIDSCTNNDGGQINKILPEVQDFGKANLNNICNMPDTSHMSTWHKRLAYASFTALQHINFSCDPSLTVDKTNLCACEICHKSKQTRLPFPISTSVTQAKFELIHMDIWGPYTEPSLLGTSFMLTIVDDFSRATWIYLLQSKAEVSDVFETFVNTVENHFGSRVKNVRTDNGIEFVNIKLTSLLNKHGIMHQRSSPYTPQQNGIVERKHRHILKLVRSLMLQSALPKEFWPFFLLTATCIVNRLPTQVLGRKTPNELLHGRKPDYSHLRTFGCLGFVTNTAPQKGKFKP